VRFVAVGDVFVDVICGRAPRPGRRVHADVSLRPGGSAVNAALSAASLGAEAAVVGRVGSDHAAELVTAALAAAGVDAILARDPDLGTGVAVALLGDEGPGVVADRGANARFCPADVPDRLDGSVLLVSGFALLQEGSGAAAQAALERFTGDWAGIDLASPALARDADLAATARLASVVFATAAEARAATGLEPVDAVRELARSFSLACVKLGAEGALAAQTDLVERRAAPPVAGPPSFGAGDAFAAAFLVSLARGDALGAALDRACAAGAKAVHGRSPV
jgi:sugar/nucleoside kinase (ribokinase family)